MVANVPIGSGPMLAAAPELLASLERGLARCMYRPTSQPGQSSPSVANRINPSSIRGGFGMAIYHFATQTFIKPACSPILLIDPQMESGVRPMRDYPRCSVGH